MFSSVCASHLPTDHPHRSASITKTISHPPGHDAHAFPYSSILVHLYYIRLWGTTKIMELSGLSPSTHPGWSYDDRCTATVNGLSRGGNHGPAGPQWHNDASGNRSHSPVTERNR